MDCPAKAFEAPATLEAALTLEPEERPPAGSLPAIEQLLGDILAAWGPLQPLPSTLGAGSEPKSYF